MSRPTVVEYVVERLAKLDITDCFGVPGDYAFPFNNAIAENEKVQWLGCSNALSVLPLPCAAKNISVLDCTYGSLSSFIVDS
jgi:indolepyruvate decarboxylase